MRLAALGAALCLAGCATEFVRPGPEILRLGETTRAELVAKLGPPAATSPMERNGKPVTNLTYIYAAEHEKPHGYDGIIPVRVLNLMFHEERLVGHEFSSTVAKDHTDFDLRAMRALVKGKTTRDEVQKLLGRPSGYLKYPAVDLKEGEAMVYSYRENRRVPLGAPLSFTKLLLISFTKEGTVDELGYWTTGNR